MSTNNDKVLNYVTLGVFWLGVGLLALYFFYLLFPGLFENEAFKNSGVIFYSLATAGCAFVPWGILLKKVGESGVSRQEVMRASAVGFALLGLMRVGTALFPHVPFDSIRFVPVTESIIFFAIAFKLFKL